MTEANMFWKFSTSEVQPPLLGNLIIMKFSGIVNLYLLFPCKLHSFFHSPQWHLGGLGDLNFHWEESKCSFSISHSGRARVLSIALSVLTCSRGSFSCVAGGIPLSDRIISYTAPFWMPTWLSSDSGLGKTWKVVPLSPARRLQSAALRDESVPHFFLHILYALYKCLIKALR